MQLSYVPYFSASTARVKSIAFHRHKPVLLLGLHSGLIQAWDYLLCMPVLNFQSHEGPVRSVIFHPHADIFASGGDDCKVRLWNYQTRKAVHTFKGHRDYIRDLDFHSTKPWLLSASDDQTVKIWDIQSYKLIATLSGHTNYVMSAKFLDVNYVVSGSLDETIRVWNTSALSKSNKSKMPNILNINDVVSELTLDAHEKGINNIYVHNNTFISSSDDKTVKVWEYYRGTVIHKETLSYHYKNVTCSYLNDNIIISVGEDGNLFLYDREKKVNRRNKIEERYWCIKNYNNFYAVGTDNGFQIFKIEENKPTYKIYKNILYYAKNNKLIKNDLKKEEEIMTVQNNLLNIQIYNNIILLQYKGRYEIYEEEQLVNKEEGEAILMDNEIIVKRDNKAVIKNIRGKEINALHNINGNLLSGFNSAESKETSPYFFTSEKKKLTIYNKNKIENFKISGFTYKIEDVVMNDIVAVIGKKDITFTDMNLNVLYSVNEMVDITSYVFQGEVFIYSTLKQIKYVICHTKNDIKFSNGVLNSIDKEIYLIKREEDRIYYFSNDIINRMLVDLLEIEYKMAVLSKDTDKVKEIIKNNTIPGLSIIEFMIEHSMGQLILEHIENREQRYNIYIKENKLREALETIKEMETKDKKYYKKLLTRALAAITESSKEERENLLKIAEECLWKLKDYKGLYLFYISTKQLQKLRKILFYVDSNLQAEIGMLLGDKELIKALINKENIDERVYLDVIEGESVDIDKLSMQTTIDREYANVEESVEKMSLKSAIEKEPTEDKKSVENSPIEQPDNNKVSIEEEIDKNLEEDIEWEEENNSIIDIEKYNNIKDGIEKIEDLEQYFKNIIGEIEKGKFSRCTRMLKNLLYSTIEGESDDRERIGEYLSGLLSEKKRKSVTDEIKSIGMARYFSMLNLDDKTKGLALRNYVSVLTKYDCHLEAIRVCKENKDKVEDSIRSYFLKIIKQNKQDNKYNIEYSGEYCYDTMEYEKEWKVCRLCGTKSKKVGACECCDIGIVN